MFDCKSKTERSIPLSEEALEHIRQRMKALRPEDRILTKDGKPWGKQGLRPYVLKCCIDAGIEYGHKARDERGNRTGVVIHSLRHSRVSKWIAMGFSDEVVRKASGHKSLEAFRRYVHLDPLAVTRLVENRGFPEETAREPLTVAK